MPSKRGNMSSRELKTLLEKNKSIVVVEKTTKETLPNGTAPKQISKSGRTQHSDLKSNKLEEAFHRILSQQYTEVHSEKFLIPLGDRCTYRPDFLAISEKEISFFEVKGSFWEDDAVVKCKVASRIIQPIPLIIAQKKKGIWKKRTQKALPLPRYQKELFLEEHNSLLIQWVYPNPKEQGKYKKRTLPTKSTTLKEGILHLEVETQNLEKDFVKTFGKKEAFNLQECISSWEEYICSALIIIKWI